jgi:hypothetical protein
VNALTQAGAVEPQAIDRDARRHLAAPFESRKAVPPGP